MNWPCTLSEAYFEGTRKPSTIGEDSKPKTSSRELREPSFLDESLEGSRRKSSLGKTIRQWRRPPSEDGEGFPFFGLDGSSLSWSGHAQKPSGNVRCSSFLQLYKQEETERNTGEWSLSRNPKGTQNNRQEGRRRRGEKISLEKGLERRCPFVFLFGGCDTRVTSEDLFDVAVSKGRVGEEGTDQADDLLWREIDEVTVVEEEEDVGLIERRRIQQSTRN